jgi:hypothetical protein
MCFNSLLASDMLSHHDWRIPVGCQSSRAPSKEVNVKISEVLSIHGSYTSDNCFADILGDAFLMKYNSTYRNIRLYSLKVGCNYSEASALYLMMPFNALGEIVGTKTVPYIPSAKLLMVLEKVRANVLDVDDISVPESHHLHEAAHFIAEHVFSDFKPREAQDQILRAIVCESFANTIDALSCVWVDSEEHNFFLRYNCYMHPSKSNNAIMSRLIKALGLKFTFMCLMYAYIHSNFLIEEVPANVFATLADKYATGVEFTTKMANDCSAIMKIANKLDPLFRIQTSQMYFKLEGHEGEIYEMLNFQFMKIFEGNKAYEKAVEKMAEIAIEEGAL